MRAVFALFTCPVARSSRSPRGHRGNVGTSLRFALLGEAATCASVHGASDNPNASLSTPAHATITPLSTHHLGGGVTSGRAHREATSERRSRTTALDATPPATTTQLSVSPSSRRSFAHSTARDVRSVRCVTATRWKDAAMFARVRRVAASSSSGEGRRLRVVVVVAEEFESSSESTSSSSSSSSESPPREYTFVNAPSSAPTPPTPRSLSIANRTAVFRPAYEKSQSFRRRSGTGNLYDASSPSRASASSAGPPPPPTFNPNSRAVLSYASPSASSSVLPRMT